jgi:hypothetical protein
MRKLFVAAATVAIFALLVSPAFGAPAKPSGSLAMTSQARLTSSSTYGQTTGLDASYQGVKQQDTVRVQVICVQDGSVVYGDTVLTGSPSTLWFVLGQPTNGTSVWTSGPASCRSDLYVVSGGAKIMFLASVAFAAAG